MKDPDRIIWEAENLFPVSILIYRCLNMSEQCDYFLVYLYLNPNPSGSSR
jgi:hypothetical protein